MTNKVNTDKIKNELVNKRNIYMTDFKKNLIDFGISFFNKLLWQNKYTINLKKYIFKYINTLYELNKIISKVQILSDDTLFIILNDGTRFYGLKDKDTIFGGKLKYANLKRLSKFREIGKNIWYYSGFLETLCEQYIDDIYEKYYKIKKGDIVVDVGANVGIFTIKAAKEVGNDGKVIAVEPEGECLSMLQRNIQENKLRNVLVIQKGVWIKKDKLKFYISPSSTGHSFYESIHYKVAEIEVDSLDNILKEYGIERTDFVKLDIEGAEVEAVKGMNEVLKSGAKIVIASYHLINNDFTYKTILPYLREKKFKVHLQKGIVYAIPKG
uniref:FkbM family methyltransferase n=1 Tax=candidate division WOR-3 bacterium TaxID=2052148 RepID=A0A7C4U847_UNCW3